MAEHTRIGVDVGSTSVRAMETRRGKANCTVVNFGVCPLPDGAVQAGVVFDPDAVTEALKQLWADHSFKTSTVTLAVTSAQVVVREMTMPKMSAKELKLALPFQVRDILPNAAESSLLDFYPLEKAGPETEMVRGLLMAAPKEGVLTLVNAVRKAGLNVAGVDLAALALMRSVATLTSRVEVVVDIGARVSTVVILMDGEPRMVRTVAQGGAAITELVAARLQVRLREAEELKRRFGLGSAQPAHPSASNTIARLAASGESLDLDMDFAAPTAADFVGRTVQEAIRPLIGEIRSSLAYVRGAAEYSPQLLLTGAGSLLPGLVDLLGEELGLDVVLADPMLRLDDDRDRLERRDLLNARSSTAVCIGLTLGAA